MFRLDAWLMSIILLFLAISVHSEENYFYRVQKVVDGDGLNVVPWTDDNASGGQVLKVRLSCIDAPELGPQMQPYGKDAQQALAALTPVGSKVTLIKKGNDIYKRQLAEVLAVKNGVETNVNKEMVRLGLAFVYCYFMDGCDAAGYYALESEARSKCLYIWNYAPNGITRPWDFRRMMKDQSPFPDSCPTRTNQLACAKSFPPVDKKQLEDDRDFEEDVDTPPVVHQEGRHGAFFIGLVAGFLLFPTLLYMGVIDKIKGTWSRYRPSR